ncbi:hypothetical protein HETIRDRAFT_50323 [Heterobasidion irregulare TC 32-1]|uniref:FAD-binding domain-containing protein n=1 Tax=Heterobasidion irregulare (strain TC 32-1) TaxID=747525 RepID=W4K0L7_HETIT|nr:uncharacterized protein HETIRDRAFT_50323 [Heterobasidion irregulare TC 32-1]ETW79363.1 hypothetical protein HETIRDRAFT_50323 [Heterobasidion irregulare TC 32-1]
MEPKSQSHLSDERLGELGYAQALQKDSSGISIIIVGCGFAGLACAIESVRKGHSVIVLEKYEEHRQLGGHLHPDFASITSEEHTFCCRRRTSSHFHIHNYQGELIQKQPFPQSLYGSHAYNGHRAELHGILVQHALALGVEIRMGQRVTEFFEDAERKKAGVVSNGVRMEADLVVGADGVRSVARKLVLGYDDKPKSSGYAIYRAWFDAKAAGIDQDPLTAFLAQGEDVLYGWIGQDVHFLTSNCKNGTDDADISESWSFPGEKSAVLDIVKDWDPRCAAILSKAPAFVDWKLVYREPLPTWISPGARLALIGDAAHPFLPTSIQGASQAVEDGVSLAALLQLAGREDVPLAVQSWEHIRYQRVRFAQLLGESTRNKWHRSTLEDRGSSMDLPRPEWLLDFDAEREAYDLWGAVSEKIRQEGYKLPELP